MRILSLEAAQAAARPRLNLIFHGLVAFYDVDPYYYDVLIPNTACTHEAKYGDPLDCPRPPVTAHLRRFHHDDHFPGPSPYRLEGVPPPSAAQICVPSPANAIILSGLDVDESNVLIKIRVPKPFIIRHYRGTETHGTDITGNDAGTQGCLQQPPDVVHEVTVFSYFSFYEPRLVGPDDCFRIPKRQDGNYWNLCVYSQPETGDCGTSDHDAFGKMFFIKKTGGRPSVNLSLPIGSDDGPPHHTAIGIQCVELLALSELDYSNECDCDKKLPAAEVRATAVPGGCGGGFIKP